MPIYEYRCPKCGIFEVVQSMSADELEECPDCGQKIKRIISKPAIIFNCSGFYCTDYAKNNSTGNTKAAPKSKQEDDKKSSPDKEASKDNKTA